MQLFLCKKNSGEQGLNKFFPFLLFNYCLIHYAVLPELGGKITKIIFQLITKTECNNVLFCNPIWRIVVAGWTAPFQSQTSAGAIGYFMYAIELVILNFLVVVITSIFFFSIGKSRLTYYSIYILSCFLIIPIPNEVMSQCVFLKFLSN